MNTPNQSDTPLTDAEIEKTGPDFVQFFLPDFARNLERKLADEKRACMEAVKSIQSHRDELAEAKARITELERGEYICKKCHLRNDDTHPKGDF